LTLDRGVPSGISPVNVARSITVQLVRRKSSAVSVWIFPGLATRDKVAILPSGLPVEKKKEVATAGGARIAVHKVRVKARVKIVSTVLIEPRVSRVGVRGLSE